MLFLAVALYFLLACLISWLVLFPSGRTLVLRALAGTGNRLQRGWRAAAQRESRRLDAIGRSSGASLREVGDFMRRHYLLCLGGALLLAVPPLVAWMSAGHAQLSDYEESPRSVNTQVAALLEGEQLVPPPPLPPLAFASAEVQQERPMIVSASRDWALLNVVYQQRLLHVFRIMKERHGYDMAILEGYRSPQRQDMLAAMGPGVTNAAAFQSWHQYGLAADCAFVRNGRIVISEKDPWAMRGYQLYGEVAESMGLTWGGRWKMQDLGHTELRMPGVMKRR
ncbi:M15 family metallopeptidase [Pseudoduganella lutea]|uniref:M15 family peptidase n=1 Tax=Pseudoduganella lutea TaxID=321985 RepID=A0A4P6L536_9BURK|nr:M15 family metallopeptidase [Pseudoduganella lutea]QBE65952.1 M15 family peptidase [Pseudoduganella lutea]